MKDGQPKQVMPCPDGDACPDARRYGAIHPAPAASEAPDVAALVELVHSCAEEFYRYSDYVRANICRDAIAMLRRLSAEVARAKADAALAAAAGEKA